MSRFARSTAVVTGLTTAGLALGFASNLLIAARFGVGADMDAYLAATTLPSLIALILTTSLGATFIPVFTEWREKDPREAWKITGAFTSLTGLACLGAGFAIFLFAAPVIRILTPGLGPAGVETAAGILRWLLPTILLTAVNQILAGAFFANGKFLTPLLIRVLGPLFTIVSILAFADTLHIRSLVVATLSAQAVQTGVLVVGMLRAGHLRPALSLEWNHPAVRRILQLTGPLMLGMCFYKLGPTYERWMASGMGVGAISILGYATRLPQVIQPVLTSGIAISGFALMAGFVSRGDMPGLRTVMLRSCRALFFASVPLGVLLCGFAEPVIGLVFERGAFSTRDTADVSRLFALYTLAIPAGAVGSVVGQAFYAFQNIRLPIIAGLLDIFLFAVLGTVLAPRWGLIALPAGYVLSLYATSLLITHWLARSTGFPVLPLFLRPFSQSLAAALAALALGLALEHFLSASYQASVLCMAAAGLAYLLLQHFVFRSPETARLLQALGRRKEASP